MAAVGKMGWIRLVVASLVVAGGLAISATAGGREEKIPGPVAAQVLSVIDGDTIIARARIWLGQRLETRVRLAGVNTPELRGKCPEERLLARRARDLVRTMIADGDVLLRDIQYGKYAGRVVARVQVRDGGDLSRALLEAGLGRPYDGGRRLSWCRGNGG